MKPATVVAVCVVAAGCGSGRSGPTAPSSVATPGVPIIRAITVDRTNVEAGSEITLTATLDQAVTPARFRFVWTVTPAAGSLAGDGATARWRAPATDPVPASYVFSVSAVESIAGASTSSVANLTSQAGATSPTVIVNDARRETQSHATSFLADMANAGVAPDLAVRNFADSCSEGKRTAENEVATLRNQYSAATTSYTLQLFIRSVEWVNCTGPDGSATCALLVYTVDTTWSRRSDGVNEHTHGYQYLRATYERNRWWLCSSRFADNPNALR